MRAYGLLDGGFVYRTVEGNNGGDFLLNGNTPFVIQVENRFNIRSAPSGLPKRNGACMLAVRELWFMGARGRD